MVTRKRMCVEMVGCISYLRLKNVVSYRNLQCYEAKDLCWITDEDGGPMGNKFMAPSYKALLAKLQGLCALEHGDIE